VLLAAGISRFASLLDGASRELLSDQEFEQIVEKDLSDGRHRNPTGNLNYFTTAYFHRPDELRDEVSAAGFVVRGFYGIEGPAWILGDFADRWQDEKKREAMIGVARVLESETSVIGCSAHLLAVGQRR
jgi:hypothetical protein